MIGQNGGEEMIEMRNEKWEMKKRWERRKMSRRDERRSENHKAKWSKRTVWLVGCLARQRRVGGESCVGVVAASPSFFVSLRCPGTTPPPNTLWRTHTEHWVLFLLAYWTLNRWDFIMRRAPSISYSVVFLLLNCSNVLCKRTSFWTRFNNDRPTTLILGEDLQGDKHTHRK